MFEESEESSQDYQQNWEKCITLYMQNLGWTLDVNDDYLLGFHFRHEDGTYLIRDYDKKNKDYKDYDASDNPKTLYKK